MNKVIENIKRLALAYGFIAMAAMYSPINATHIVGADMTFECLGNDFYQIDLVVRRDCINGADDAEFDTPALVGIFDAFGNPLDFLERFGRIEMPLLSVDTINPSLPECAYLGGEVCVEEGVYSAIVHLPFREKGYVLGYQRCCRNITLNNIVSPTLTGNTSFVCLTEPTLNSCNSMPAFDEWPEIVICADEPFVFDHSAIDRDGDSLVYMLHTPFAGASEDRPRPDPPSGPQYDTIEYAEGFTLDNLLGVGEPLAIDPVSGIITATPGAVGQYLVGVLVAEYRDGKVLSKTRRNFELNVRACEDVARLGYEAPELTCDGLTVEFTNTSTKDFGFTWNFSNPSMDETFMSNEESPTFTFPQEGVYEVKLSSTNPENGCEVSVIKDIAVYNSELTADFEITSGECLNGMIALRLTATSVEPNTDLTISDHRWEIVVGDEVIPLFGEVVETSVSCTDEIMVSLTSFTSNGCSDNIIRTEQIGDPNVSGLIDLINDTLRICIGDNTPLLNSSSPGVTYTWSPMDSLSFTDTDNFSDPIANPTETTLYTVTATDGINSDDASVLVIVDMIPEFTFGVDSTELCRSGSQIPTINGDPSYEYQYDPSDEVNTSSPYGPNDPLFSPTGDGYFYVTVTNGACVIIDSVFVTAIGNDPIALDEAFVAEPQISNNDDGSININVPFNFDELNEQFDIDSVYWEIVTENETITRNGTDISATVQPASMATVNVFIVDSNGCVVKITRIIDLGNVPTIEFLSDDDTISICAGDTSFVVSNPNSEWTYTWDPEDGLIFDDPEDRSNPRVSISESMLYVVTVSNGTNSVVDSIFIEALTEMIDVSIESDGANICDGMAVVTAVNNTNGNATDFEWALDSMFNTIVAIGENASINIPGDSATIYVRGNTDGFCGSNVASLDVVDNSVDLTPSFDPINTCVSPDGSVSLINNDSSQTVMILWEDSDNITSDDLTSPDILIERIGDEMSVELTYTASNDRGCSTTQTISVPVTDELMVEIGGDTESCTTTGSFFADANAPADSVNFEWSLTEDFAEIISTSDSVTADLGSTGIIYVRANTNSGCESPVVSRMLEMQDIQIDFDAPSRICLGDTADVDLLFPDGQTYDVTWEDNPAIVSELTGPKVFIAGLGGSDTITLRYTADDGEGCVIMDEIMVVNSTVIDPAPTNDVVCGTLDQEFTIDPIYVDGDVVWSFEGIGANPTTSTSAAPTISFDSAGIYRAMLVSTMETCNFDSTEFFFEVPEVLEIMTDQPTDQLLCGDSILMLRATSNGDAITWTDVDGNLLAVGDSVEINAADITQVIASTLDANGCSDEIVFNIDMFIFDVTINAPTDPVCSTDGGIDVSAMDNSGANVSYEWTSASGGVISGGDTANPTIDPANSEDLQLTVTNEDLGCSMTFDVPITGGSLNGSITSDAPNNEIDLGGEATISVEPSGDDITYMWDDGSTEGPDRTVMPDETTTYTVTITDESTGCTSVQMITITVDVPECNDEGIFLPTAFSPNNDGENDELFVRSNIIETMDLQVLDRWGREVFRNDQQDIGWNGLHRNTGDELAPDTYAYCLKVVCTDGQEFLKAGHITIAK